MPPLIIIVIIIRVIFSKEVPVDTINIPTDIFRDCKLFIEYCGTAVMLDLIKTTLLAVERVRVFKPANF